MEKIWHPILRQYRPDTVLVSIGVDCHYMDPLTGLSLSSPAMLEMVDGISSLSRELTGKGTTLILEGGYNMDVLAEVFGSIFSGDRETKLNHVVDEDGKGLPFLDAPISYQSRFWDL